MAQIYQIYKLLYKRYGAQGWWPFLTHNEELKSKTGNIYGYHPKDYSYPKNEDQIFEVALGSILTQNTTFVSVVKALQNLLELDAITSKKIQMLEMNQLKEAIRPAGYFNQKSQYIHNFIEFYDSLKGRVPSRDELLKIKGIGEETADSILLYGYKQPQFKVDAYTKRFLLHLGLIDEKTKYKDIKKLFEEQLKQEIADKEELIIVYQEYHALIVEHGKNYYSKKPYAVGCFVKENL